MNVCLQYELDWINNNQHLYQGAMHIKLVKKSIVHRYREQELQQEISRLRRELESKI